MVPLFVVRSGCVSGQKALVLSLLPLDPRRAGLVGLGHARPGEPGLDRRAERRVAAKPERELELGETDTVPRTKLRERVHLIQLADAVAAIAGIRALG